MVPSDSIPSLTTSLGQVASEALRSPTQSHEERPKSQTPKTSVPSGEIPIQNAELNLVRVDPIDGDAKSRGLPDDAQPMSDTDKPSKGNVVLGATVINAGSARPTFDLEKGPAATNHEFSGAATASNGECARRYASFRESDGTYQPHNSIQRRRCPLLRNKSE